MFSAVVHSTGQNPLHLAVSQWADVVDKDIDRLAAIQAIISSGLNVNIPDNYGDTPLHIIMREIGKNEKMYGNVNLEELISALGKDVKMSEVAARLRPHWHVAAAVILAMNGADPRIVNAMGQQATQYVPSLANVLFSDKRCSYSRPKSLLPMKCPSDDKIDMTEVIMCTFGCDDQPADVSFEPCGHRVICTSCISNVSLRRCPLCYKSIESAINTRDGSSMEVCRKAAEEKRQAELEEMRRREEEAARAIEEKKEKEMEELRARLEELEQSVQQCVICMDAVPGIAFLCGHRACVECASALTTCHSCRKPIKERITLFN